MGVETSDFDEAVDPSIAAEFLTTTIKGSHTRWVAVNHSSEHLYEIMTRYVETHLIADGTIEGMH